MSFCCLVLLSRPERDQSAQNVIVQLYTKLHFNAAGIIEIYDFFLSTLINHNCTRARCATLRDIMLMRRARDKYEDERSKCQP